MRCRELHNTFLNLDLENEVYLEVGVIIEFVL